MAESFTSDSSNTQRLLNVGSEPDKESSDVGSTDAWKTRSFTEGEPGEIRQTSAFVTRDEAISMLQTLSPEATVPKWELKALVRHASSRATTFIQGRRTALASSTFNLMNAIMGSGMLGLPYIMSRIGILLFAVLMLGMACLVER